MQLKTKLLLEMGGTFTMHVDWTGTGSKEKR
jgi:hypothetical protein